LEVEAETLVDDDDEEEEEEEEEDDDDDDDDDDEEDERGNFGNSGILVPMAMYLFFNDFFSCFVISFFFSHWCGT